MKKIKQKPKNSKSGLDTGGGVCYNAFERKRTFLSACFGSLSFIHHKEGKIIMKLKKISSLALAGVMAVSMLTACDTTRNGNDQPTQPEEPTTPATGYSATFEDRLSDLADANISMSDSSN